MCMEYVKSKSLLTINIWKALNDSQKKYSNNEKMDLKSEKIIRKNIV